MKNLLTTANTNMSILQTQIKKKNLSNIGPKICLFCNLAHVRDHKDSFPLLVSSLPAPFVCSLCIRRVLGIHFLWWPAKAQISKLQEAVRDAFAWPGLHFAHWVASRMEYSICRGQITVYRCDSHNSELSSKILRKK